MSAPAYLAEPAVQDGRPSIAALHAQCDQLLAHGFRRETVALQGGLPILAYRNADEVDWVVLGGIHGREPAGAIAIAGFHARLAELGRTRAILVLPLLNPWGYFHHERYGPSGQSVSDSDHLLGRSAAPACPEADAITRYVLEGVRIRPGAAVLDLHEDPVYEAPGYHLEGNGSYLYLSGPGALDHPVSRRVKETLRGSSLPLIDQGTTRFGETLDGGVILDAEDGSIDELLFKARACSPVLTCENILHAVASPPLDERVATYLAVLGAFFGA